MTEQHFQTHEPIDLYVEVGKGTVAVHAVDTTESRVRLEGPGAEEVDVRLEDGTLSVVQPNRTGFLRDRTVHADVTVPRGSRPAVRTGSADISLHGPVGDAEVRSGSGDVTVEALVGRGLVETGSGSVTIGTASEALRVKSGSGDVEVRHAGAEVAVSTGSGDVRLDRCAGPAAVKTGSGDLYVGESGADLAMTTGSGDLQVRRAAPGRLLAKGASGDIEIGVPGGLPVWTDLSTLSGSVVSDLEPLGPPAEGGDSLEIRARTVSGDIALRLADPS